MTNFDESQSEFHNDDPFENYENAQDDTPPNMIDFGKKTRSVMENFKRCEEIKFDNNTVMAFTVHQIKEQRKIFRKFVKGSTKFSDNLEEYAIDILFFADRFKNNRYSNEEYLEILNDLLIKSKENYRLTKELKNILLTKEENIDETDDMDKILEDIKNYEPTNLGIVNKLTIIENFLSKYIVIIKQHPYLIESDTNIKIVKEKIEETRSRVRTYAFGTIAVISGIGCLVATGPMAATAVAAEGVASLLGTYSAGYTFFGLVEYIRAGKKEGKIKDLEKELDIEVDELVKKIKLFTKNLNLMINEIRTIETFWENQIERIDDLIKKLKGFKEAEKRHKKDAIVNSIEKKWKDVERECQIYSKVMKDMLNKET
ncbi:hypothetical protein RhiirA5_485068 [Rhizophagus irregularis]|uniref:Uncharacterized protein n=1 Tax=Rhizophagus irregularis TaxID=588596 RepID=A0A2N0PFK1_9GLOM|nr:hypothetical protein RhiirA5_485068 [Rhizophagus irregularis]CAB5190795.1 unnamed protein product [Rhizophagus irregularis]